MMRNQMHYNIKAYMRRYNVSAAELWRYRYEATTSANANTLATRDGAALMHIHDVLYCIRMICDLAQVTRSRAALNRQQRESL